MATSYFIKCASSRFTNRSLKGNEGGTMDGITMRVNYNSPPGDVAHEVIHTFGVGDNRYMSGGILNSPPELISKAEVDLILDRCYDEK